MKRSRDRRTAGFALLCATFLCCLLVACQSRGVPNNGGRPQNEGWPYYGGDYGSKRFADLSQIAPQNVRELGIVCKILLGDDGAFQTGPLVVDGTLYVTTAHNTGAFDAASCRKKWLNHYTPEEAYVYGANRGAAYLDHRVFRGTGDGRLLALDASDGHVLWKIKAVDPKAGEFLSSAPIAWDGLVFIGAAGSDWGIRGKMMAYDAATGARKWLFHTVPSGNETGAHTWEVPASTKTGGGAMWASYSLDPTRGELFVPVGNPAPDWNPAARPGANLFTASAIVLDAKSGRLLWWYQLVPNDSHDYDLGAPPALYADRNRVPMMAAAGKDGYVHFVDRQTHKLHVKTAVTTIHNGTVLPTKAGVFVCPGSLGGVEWNGPSVDETRDLLFVGAVDMCGTYTLGGAKDKAGVAFYGGTFHPVKARPTGWLSALDATSGKMAWQHHISAPIVAGVTATTSGVVFAGDLAGTLYAFKSEDGTPLATWKLPGSIAGGIVSYAIDGRQYVAVPSGNISRLTFGGAGSPTMTVYASGRGNGTVVDVRAPSSSTSKSGEQIFATYCVTCHGAGGIGGANGPSIKGENGRKNLAQTVQWIENPLPPMPKLYPSPLNKSDVEAVARYVHGL